MKVSEIIDSQFRRKSAEMNAELSKKMAESREVTDDILAAARKSHLISKEAVKFTGRFVKSFNDASCCWVVVDGHKTQLGNFWITNFGVHPSMSGKVAEFQENDNVEGSSLDFVIQDICKV